MSTTKVNADVLDLADDYAFTGTVTGAGGGKILQVVYAKESSELSTTGTIPFDDTLPQITEGGQALSLAITPANGTNKLLIEVNCFVGSGTTGDMTIALFNTDYHATNAMAATYMRDGNASTWGLDHLMVTPSSSATTFTVRWGNHGSGTTYLNSSGSARYSTAAASTIIITEISV